MKDKDKDKWKDAVMEALGAMKVLLIGVLLLGLISLPIVFAASFGWWWLFLEIPAVFFIFVIIARYSIVEWGVI